MKTNKIKYIKYLFIFITSALVFTACEDDDETLQPLVNAIYSADTDLNLNQGYPGDVVMAEGQNLENIKSIYFDDIIEVIFNPVFNSNLAVAFNVPFDEAKGSRFGSQTITFENKDGVSFQSEFEIVQPEPFIANFNPERPTVGMPVEINGEWFYNVLEVVYQGESMDFSVVSSEQLIFTIPADLTQGGELEIITQGGTIVGNLDIYLGFEEVLVADFDGGGLRPNNNWVSYGDFNTLEYKNTGGISGNYTEFTWAGASANGYNGCQSDAGATMLEETNAEKVVYLIDVNANAAIGTIIDLLIVDTDGVNWAFNYVIETDGWQTVEALVADFGKNYDPSNQSDGDANPANINQVKVTIAQNNGTPNPSTVQFDNIRWQVYESVQPSRLPATVP